MVDANLNGYYNDIAKDLSLSDEPGGDFLAIDLNHDGRLDPEDELCPLPRRIMSGGVLYRLSVQPDGSMVRLKPETPDFKWGQLEAENKNIRLTAFSFELGPFRLDGAAGPRRLPSGSYAVICEEVLRTDADGAQWAMKRLHVTQAVKGNVIVRYVTKDGAVEPVVCERQMGKRWGRGFRISPAVPAKLATPVPEFRLDTDARRVEIRGEVRTVRVEAQILDQKILEYHCSPIRNGRPLGPPKMRIVDEGGRVLAAGTMSYSWRGRPVYFWKVPHEFKGKFRVLVAISSGPFKIEHDERWFDATRLSPFVEQWGEGSRH